jgi:hypothetical protein
VQPSLLRTGVEPEPLPVPMPRARPAAQDLAGAATSPTMVVRHDGAFVHTFCAQCCWRGPGRRATTSALRDWRGHLADAHRSASEREAEVGG